MSDTPVPGDLHASGLVPGARVEVRNRFDGSWAAGFEIAGPAADGWEIRRLLDGSVLPSVFPPQAVRPPS
jgi:hypothetical protein